MLDSERPIRATDEYRTTNLTIQHWCDAVPMNRVLIGTLASTASGLNTHQLERVVLCFGQNASPVQNWANNPFLSQHITNILEAMRSEGVIREVRSQEESITYSLTPTARDIVEQIVIKNRLLSLKGSK